MIKHSFCLGVVAAFMTVSNAAHADANMLEIQRGFWKETITQSQNGVLKGKPYNVPETSSVEENCYLKRDDLQFGPNDLLPVEQCTASVISSNDKALSISFICEEDGLTSEGTTVAYLFDGGTRFDIMMTFQMTSPSADITSKIRMQGERQVAICNPDTDSES